MCLRRPAPRSMPNGRQAPSLDTAPRSPNFAPLNLVDSRPKVYCWHRHVQFVGEWMMQNLNADVQVRAVNHPEQLAGIENITFVQVDDVDTVNDRYSDSLAAISAQRGFTILTIDDSQKRQAFARKHGYRS